MTDYIQFSSSDGSTIFVEVEEGKLSSHTGLQQAGLRETVGKTIAMAQSAFEEALGQVIKHNAQAFIQSVSSLPVLPNEAELTFELNATGEVGNIAVAKAGGQANYVVKLIWKRA